MSTSATFNNQKSPIDISTLKFLAPSPVIDKVSGSDYHAFTKRIPILHALSRRRPRIHIRHQTFQKFKYTPPPEPLVEIIVRTVDRKLIPPGEFYIYMDEYSEDFLQFSMSVFDKNGRIKPSLCQSNSEKGTGVWGREINKGTIAYIEEVRIHPKYQRQGLGRLAIENLLKSDVLAHCPFFFLWSTVLNDRSPFDGPDPHFDFKKRGVTSFFRSVGFRRVGKTWFFGYARDPTHPMRSLKMEDDAGDAQIKGYTPLDAHDASFYG